MVDNHELIIVIGQSGAGRTTVIHILDDQGFDTLDNVPVHLIPRVASRELVDKPLALGLDIRSKSFSVQNLMKEIINWKALENQSLDETINALAMASPFTLEEKQVLLETKNLNSRKSKIADILTTYTFDQYNNTTIQ